LTEIREYDMSDLSGGKIAQNHQRQYLASSPTHVETHVMTDVVKFSRAITCIFS